MNLFQISMELNAIYDDIEENGGEITPEIEERLNIAEGNFKGKINDYVSLIRILDGQIGQCSEEAKRIAKVKKSKENLKERLSGFVIKAIEEFGDSTPKGTKYVDFGTYKVSTRKSAVCEINQDAVDLLSEEYKDTVRGYFYNKAFDLGKDLTEDTVNRLKEVIGTDIDEDDLRNLETKITFKSNALALLSPEMATLMKLSNEEDNVEVEFGASKTNCKNAIKAGDAIIYAEMKENTSLIIK